MSMTTMASVPSNPASDDEKSHTFRKRRLSLSRHNIAPESDASISHDAGHAAAVPAAVTEKDVNASDDVPPLPVVVAPANDDESTAAESAASDQKAHTFRKRRLSLTLKPHIEPNAVEENEAEEEGSNNNNDQRNDIDIDETSSPANKKQKITQELAATTVVTTRPRRASDASATSLNSNNTGDGLRVRTLHAGEIVGQHARYPPSPAFDYTGMNSNNLMGNQQQQPVEPHVLYRLSRPNSMSLLKQAAHADAGATDSQPKWKKRIIRKHDEDERKLPFPRDIVGTYSCHGVEPVYDSDYDHMEDDEEDSVDNWTEDISGAKTASPSLSPKTAAAMKPTREPKPTTAAKINQDRGGVAFPYGKCPKTALFAAYDGHGQGGELVSQFALHEIQSRLEKQPDFNTNLKKAFVDTFLAVDEALRHEPLIEPLYAGTTACVALLRDDTLTVANTGDSRAVVARKKRSPDGSDDVIAYQAIDLTVDQNPDLPEERKRIEDMGGFVSPPPEPGLSARVWLDEGFSQIGLAMARSIGDHAVAQVGVIAEPIVTTHNVEDEDEFLIIATDGVWEFISSEAAVEIVRTNLARGATKATQALIEAAAARWHDEEGDYRDDITALVVRLNELWKGQPTASLPAKS